MPKKLYGSVRLFQSKEEVPGVYYVSAIMSVEGDSGDEAAFIKAFLYRAADVGADGLILYRVSSFNGEDVTISKSAGAANPSQHSVYRGEAINFGAEPTNSLPIQLEPPTPTRRVTGRQ